MIEEKTKRKTIALNNSARPTTYDKKKSKKLLKEEMYLTLLNLMEKGKIFLLNDEEVKASLASIQYEDEKVFGFNKHITEGIMRAIWLGENQKINKLWIY